MYLVGGAIRDTQLGLPVHDQDYCIETNSFESMLKILTQKNFKITTKYPQFGTCKTTRGDISLCRDEDGNPTDIIEDLARRDFTVNAIAQDSNGQFIDPFNGLQDIKDKVIRCIGSINRIAEDPVRMLRAMRFSITKGLKLENRICCILQDPKYVDKLRDIPLVNIRQELNKCFDYDTLKTLEFMEKYPLLKGIFLLDLRLKVTLKNM